MRLQGREIKINMRGEDVARLHQALQSLGFRIPKQELQQRRFGQATRAAVLEFQQGHGLGSSGVVDELTATRMDSLLAEPGMTAPAEENVTSVVEGRVASRSRAGVGGLRVVIVDRNVGKDLLLAETATDDGGKYRATFTLDDLRKRGKQQPDLQARVFAEQKLLGASEVRYNASLHETLNILLTAEASAALPAEYKTLTGDLFKHFKGQLGDLKETVDRQDITYLANKTGWDARAVALAALADQFSARTGDASGAITIQPAFFYALFRAGLPANEKALYRTDAETAAAIWKRAIAQGVIPTQLEERIPQAVEHFQRLTATHALEGPAIAGVSSLKELLTVSLGNDAAMHRKFARLRARYGADWPGFWQAVRGEFGEQVAKRLKLDGQLAYLTLNNAPLIRKLHQEMGPDGLDGLLGLVQQGFYRAERWQQVSGSAPIPPEIRDDNEAEKQARYTELLAAQVRLSYPTAVVAQMVKNGETPLTDGPAKFQPHVVVEQPVETPLVDGLAGQIYAFLMEHQDRFEIGMQPVEQYITLNNIQEKPEVVKEITRIQRVYQITPTDEAMNVLLRKGLDSAYKVVRYDRDRFVQTFQDELGGEKVTRLTYAKAEQVHNAVLNIATAYLTAGVAPGIGSHSDPHIVNPQPKPPANVKDVIAYATLESLFGEMDYCTCEHCRSILSPAAYLVDLLLFLDPPDAKDTPLQVLLDRRPDIQHLPLTCENTNTPLPYIDLVNETLEYFVSSNLSLANYTGHTMDGEAKPEELLASPQFVSDVAYTTLAGAHFPPPLPFHQPLENLRRYFDKFEIPLPEAMEILCKHNTLERANANEYGWRDILMEELRLSRAEYILLTQRELTNDKTDVMLTVKMLYGFDLATSDQAVRKALGNARSFCRRVGITYEDLLELLNTRFVNPHSTLIPKLEKLGVPFTTLKALKDGAITDDAFDDLLPEGLDATQYDGDITAWVKNDANYANIMSLITIANPTEEEDLCSFDSLELRYANPDNDANQLRAFEFIRLIRLIRLWKKLGWTIEQTDKAITTLYPVNQIPTLHGTDAVKLEKLDAGFLILLPRLGVIKRLIDALKLKPNKDLLPLLACFAPIDTHGANSLYRQMFTPALQKQTPAFADNGYGEFLTDAEANLLTHAETLRAAFQLTGEEFGEIAAALRYGEDTPLGYAPTDQELEDLLGHVPDNAERASIASLLRTENISQVFRRGWLARKLKLSVRELLLLMQVTGIDPFAAPDAPDPPILRLINFVDRLRAAAQKLVQALYLIWNRDISGKSAPGADEMTQFARILRAGFAVIESEFAFTGDPEGQIARTRMALVYGNEATDLFFGLLGNTFVSEVPYSHDQATLEEFTLDAAPGRVAYDDFRKRLSFTGVLTTAIRDALKVGVTAQFEAATDKLYEENQKVIGPFFDRYPELLPLYDAFVFFGELKNTVPYVHTQNSLGQAILDVAPGRIAYDHTRNEISFKGVLTVSTCEALKVVAGVTVQFQAAVDNLLTANQAAIQGFFAGYPTLVPQQAAYLAANDALDQRWSVLLANFLPELKRRRKRQQALQTISAAAKSDISFANALLYDANILHALGPAPDDLTNLEIVQLNEISYDMRPALDDLTAIEQAGLSAQFFFRDPATDEMVRISDADAEANLDYSVSGDNRLPSNPNNPAHAISGVWTGYLEAPENGFYNICLEADAGAVVTLTLDGVPVALEPNGNVWSNRDPIEWRAGKLYAICLQVENVRETLRVQWQTTGRGWEIIPPCYLYSATLTDHLGTVYVRFLKAASLAGALKLTAHEIAHFAGHDDYKIADHGWLNSLPVIGSADDNTATALLKVLTTLLDFAHMKAALAPDDERLLTVLKDPDSKTQSGDHLLLALTRWESTSLHDLLIRFGKTAQEGLEVVADRSALKDVNTFSRIHHAYGLVKKLGIPAAALIRAVTNDPSAAIVRDLQSALRARYDESDWLQVLRPINDEMRGLQRDALVAYILHQMRANPKSAHIDTPDKLFEYFLMDVQMDPCMQTSRVRHALSSVQLFIERCLMDLERDVAPSSINAQQWAWMKRYRVWEANRKVFLYPENWLEPELRDDQSPFFKEAMSELLQGDITEDRAAVALLNYLAKLDEVAKLEPCGMYYEEPDSGQDNGVVHVVARTAGANRKYYYRRREPSGWTPWEQIKLDIEDNPVIPVVWKDRLFLFWLRILKQSPLNLPQEPSTEHLTDEENGNGEEKKLAELKMTDIKKNAAKEARTTAKVTVQVVLCWSEYYNGKWQPTKTSDVNKPRELGQFVPTGEEAFDRSTLKLGAVPDDELLVYIYGSGIKTSWFRLYNSHSLPVHDQSAGWDRPFSNHEVKRVGHILWISDYIGDDIYLDRDVLTAPISFTVVRPLHLLQSYQDAPFFFEDSRHVFYVTTTGQIVPIRLWNVFGWAISPMGEQTPESPPLVVGVDPHLQPPPREPGPAAEAPGMGVTDPVLIEQFVTEDAYINKGIGITGAVRYGESEIGLAGALDGISQH